MQGRGLVAQRLLEAQVPVSLPTEVGKPLSLYFYDYSFFSLVGRLLYKRAADLVDSVYEDKKAVNEVCMLLHLNMAACSLKLTQVL